MPDVMQTATLPPDKLTPTLDPAPQYIQKQKILSAASVTTTERQSSIFVNFGIIQIIVSSVLFCICMVIISISSEEFANYLTILYGLYCGVVFILSIVGGQDISEERCFVGTSVGSAFLGIVIVYSYTVSSNVISWLKYNRDCKCVEAEESSSSYGNFTILKCYVTKCDDSSTFLVIDISIQVIINGIIAIVGFAYMWQCFRNQQTDIPRQITQLNTNSPSLKIQPTVNAPSQEQC